MCETMHDCPTTAPLLRGWAAPASVRDSLYIFTDTDEDQPALVDLAGVWGEEPCTTDIHLQNERAHE